MAHVKKVSSKASSGKYFWLLFAAGVAVFSILWAIDRASDAGKSANSTAPRDAVVATINDQSVSAAEYRLVMERKVSLVYSYFKQQYNIDDHLGYWSKSSGPNGPLAKLREMTLTELTHIKAYQGLAKAKGLMQDTSFANFQTEFEQENIRRAKAMSEGQPIYGPRQYRQTTYYYIRFGDIAYKLKQMMAKELEPKVSEIEIETFYKENKVSFGDKSLADARGRIVTFLSNKEAERELDTACASAKVELKETMLDSIVPRVDPETHGLASLQRSGSN